MNDLAGYLKRAGKSGIFVHQDPPRDLSMVIVIPAYAEPGLTGTLESLKACEQPPRLHTEVVVVFNRPADAPDELVRVHDSSIEDVRSWLTGNQMKSLSVHLIDMPPASRKQAGVGRARKTGMDEAASRFLRAGAPDGIIVSLDADCRVDPDYLVKITQFFLSDRELSGCSIYFEHPLEGDEFPPEVYQAVSQYELHLRYHVNALRFAGSPYAYHTVGSCFAVRATAYARLGGMNPRQGGEDFYFLQKLMDGGHFASLTSTRVIPSARPSLRVPFGTVPVVSRWLQQSPGFMETYPVEAYLLLRDFFLEMPGFYKLDSALTLERMKKLPAAMRDFLIQQDFHLANEEINLNVGSEQAYIKRFFRWFNGFRIVKYLNSLNPGEHPKKDVKTESVKLLHLMELETEKDEIPALLGIYRGLDRGRVR